MVVLKRGDRADAEAHVTTVNRDGFMGKGSPGRRADLEPRMVTIRVPRWRH